MSDTELHAFVGETGSEDLVSSWYRDERSRKAVVAFFGELTGDEETAAAILENSVAAGVAPELAFALAFEESRYKPKARNDNGDSVDRGLFQLNSKSFPALSPAEAYDPLVNAKYGIDHLAFTLRAGGNEVAGLAMYNAGRTRVSKDGTPKRTLDYVFRIIRYEQNIADLFTARVVLPARGRLAREAGAGAPPAD